MKMWYKSVNSEGTDQKSSTDPELLASAPFKAGDSRQVQTCYNHDKTTQRQMQH